jgi:hypothetical protein
LSVFATWGTQPSKCVLEKTVVEATVDTNHFLYFCIEGGGFHLEDIRQSMCGMDTYTWAFFITCMLKKFWSGEKVDSVSQFH